MSRSGYYSHLVHTNSKKSTLENEVINCFSKSGRRYGRIRIHKALLARSIYASEYVIAKVFKKYGLIAKGGRKRKYRLPKPTEQQYIEENLIKDKFSVTKPNYLWCTDITEIKYKNGKLYCCAIIDLATRRIVGWCIARKQMQDIVQKAFMMAVGRNPERPEKAICHSDRGCQYTAKKTKELVEKHGFRKSMSRPGTPSDNQVIESFWHTLKTEMTDIRHLSFKEASRKIVDYIELFYNSERLHSSLNYLTPNEYFTLLTVQKT